MTYAEKLKDPRWQKRKSEICQRDEWRCQLCGDIDDTLHVHHKLYINGNNPWDYDDEHLVTICRTCHQIVEGAKKTYSDFDINNMRVCFIKNDSDVMVFYRYLNNRPIAFMKRGVGVAIEKPDIERLIDFIKIRSDV